MVKRVDTAVAVHDASIGKIDEPDTAVLVTGRMRPLDREEHERELRSVAAGVPRDPEAPVKLVVATQCIEAGADLDFDVVITDLLMPGGGGRAVLAAALEASGAPPVIVLTGRAEPHIAAELVALGATECLAKPATTADVLAAVDRIIAPRRA